MSTSAARVMAAEFRQVTPRCRRSRVAHHRPKLGTVPAAFNAAFAPGPIGATWATAATCSALAATVAAVLAVRLLLWGLYRPFDAVDEDALPDLAVVIPAFNEGPMVRRAIESALASRYPTDR